jgi:hypothetical protein
MVEAASDAESRMAPAAVTQLRSGAGDRKNASSGVEQWVSSMSLNQWIQSVSTCPAVRGL